MDYDAFEKKNCRYSGEPLGRPFLELGVMPLANNLVRPGEPADSEFKCPLSLTWAPESGLVQLSHVVPPAKMFDHYLYVSSTTKTFQKHFAEYAARVRQVLGSRGDAVAVDIGSNDGLLVSCYQNEGMRAVGVDPARNLSDEANRLGRPTLNRYFDAEAVAEICADYGKADVISGNNVFAHIDDIHSVLRNVQTLLKDDGVFVIEFPYLVTMLEELLFDMIYHEHLSYISVMSLEYVLARFDFEIFDIDQVAAHGGSLRVFIQKKGAPRKPAPVITELKNKEEAAGLHQEDVYRRFAGRVLNVRESFMQVIRDLRKAGKTISGYGAPAKASTIANFYGLTPADIDFVVDDNPLKQGFQIPGVRIPIVSGAHLEENRTDYVVIFAWNFAREIAGKIGHLASKGTRFLVPLPLKNADRGEGIPADAFFLDAVTSV